MKNEFKQVQKTKRNFGKTLKKVSIIVCIIGIIASLVGANITTISPKSTYSSWISNSNNFGYNTTTQFSGTLMFYYFMLTAFATVAIYSFGELLDNVIQKREIQEKLLETILENIN